MRITRMVSLGVAMVLLLTAVPHSTARADDRDKVKVTGLVISRSPKDGTFQLQEFGSQSRWVVIIRREDDEDKDEDAQRIGRLTVGDVVEVSGELLAGHVILANRIKVVGHASSQIPTAPPQSQPPAASNPPNTLIAIIKTIGIGAAVSAFAPAINNFINALLQNKGAAVQAQTKVVPILSVTVGISSPGSAYVGAAQVSGPPAALAKVQAVAVLEADYQTAFRVKALVPVDNLKPWEAFRRVPGVGVSAIIDLRI